ncbi:MAG: YheU family protein [Pirellulaceae bacterium]
MREGSSGFGMEMDPNSTSDCNLSLGATQVVGIAVEQTSRLLGHMNYTASMHIPHTQLSLAALRAIVEEFVTRDGTDHSSVDRRIEIVLRQLDAGSVELFFDDDTRTCNILSKDVT